MYCGGREEKRKGGREEGDIRRKRIRDREIDRDRERKSGEWRDNILCFQFLEHTYRQRSLKASKDPQTEKCVCCCW